MEQAGFNCVDHTVINFCPVDDAFPAGADHEAYFQHFEFSQSAADFEQIKTWKNYGQSVSMVTSGGHDLQFSGRRVYPFKFLLKHYPIRSQTHGERKVFRERKARFNPEEKAQGWHNHYDRVGQDHSFVYSPSTLTVFDEMDFNRKYLVERLSGVGVIRTHALIEASLRQSVRELKRSLQISRQELNEHKAQLEKITNSVGWRFLSLYGPIKYRLVLPAYWRVRKLLGLSSNV